MSELTLRGGTLELRTIAARDPDAPALVLLHEGLGSAEAWRDFPDRLAAETGSRTLIYSRFGYGRSSPAALPRGVDFMHREALDVLPALLDAEHISRCVLVGHSDGASIALIHAAHDRSDRIVGLALEAPHVIVEDVTVQSIAQFARTFATSEARPKLARIHADADTTFAGWSQIWLAPEFRTWDIRPELAAIRCPTLVIQGEDDEYGTWAQVDAISGGIPGRVASLRLPHCGHSPHRDRPDDTLHAIAGFVASLPALA
jgi:pimeloyl-ACP methyl ester carboxylesterase